MPLISSKTYIGSQVADSLAGGEVGYDMLVAEAGTVSPAPKVLYLRSDGFANAITNLGLHFAAMSGTYGGDYGALGDYNKLLEHGALGGGLQFKSFFDDDSYYVRMRDGVGSDFVSRVVIPASAMMYNSGPGEAQASSPSDGYVMPYPNTTKGDAARLDVRYVLPDSETQGGRRQWDLIASYNFTT